MSNKNIATDEAGLIRARAAKSKALELFDGLVGGAAVGLTRQRSGAYGLKVNLTEPPDTNVTLPTEIDGIPIKIEVVGPIRKRSS